MTDADSSAGLIDAKIAALGDWRGEVLATLRAWIMAADPGMTETVKWRKPTNPSGVPVWECAGIICTGETYKDYVKLTFMYGARLPDPGGVFNAGLGGGTRRAIDVREGGAIDEGAFKAIIVAAVAFNRSRQQE